MLNEYTYSGKYAQLVKEEKVFSVANQAAVAITAAFATTYTGLVVGNPVNSKTDLVLLECSYAATVATPTATALGLMTGKGTTDVANALTIANRNIGSTSPSVAWTEDSCTLTATPVLIKPLTTAWTEATTAGTLSQPNIVDLGGDINLPPGAFIAFYSTAANTAAFLFSFTWAEFKR
jgi:hypothetical protein